MNPKRPSIEELRKTIAPGFLTLEDQHALGNHQGQLDLTASLCSPQSKLNSERERAARDVLECQMCQEDFRLALGRKKISIADDATAICMLIDALLAHAANPGIATETRKLVTTHVMNCSRCKPIHYGS